MPAYFSITFELNKSKMAIKDFCNALVDAGLVFKSGYWGFENDSFDDIVAWNQNKLDNNFQLGYTEHYSHNFKQMLFDFSDFSEVRLYIMNDKKASTFEFHLIIPEDNFLDYGEYELNAKDIIEKAIVPKNLYQKMDLIKNLAARIWATTASLIIQTGWELSDTPPLFKEVEAGAMPLCEPFCIIPCHLTRGSSCISGENIEKDGILLEQKNNWNNVFSDVDTWVKCD